MGRSWRWILLIVFVTAVLFAPALSFFFVSDDFTLIQTAGDSSLKTLISIETWAYYRPFLLLSHAAEYALWKARPVGYHANNIFLHILNTVLVCFLARRLLGRSGRSWIFAGLLFGLTPTHASSVLWVCGRADLLCGTFYFASVLTFLLHIEKERPALRWASILSFVIALLCKEMAGTIPLVCLVWGTLVFGNEGSFKSSLVKALKSSWIYFLVLALYFVFRYLLFGHFPESPDHGTPPLGYLITNVGRYGAGLILPFDLEAVKPFFRPRPDLLLIGSLLGLGVSLVLLRFVVARRPLVFASTWIGLTLLPVLKFAGPWYLYIPSAGVALGFGYLLGALVSEGKKEQAARWIAVALIIAIHLFGLAQAEYNTAAASNIARQVLSELIQQVPAEKRAILINAPSQYRGVPVFGWKGNVLSGLQLLDQPRRLQILTSVLYATLKDPMRTVLSREARQITVHLEGNRNFFQSDEDMITFWARSRPGEAYQTTEGIVEVTALNSAGRPSSLAIRPRWLEDPSIPVLAYSEGQMGTVK